jgi:hypothetical protein
VTWSWSSGGRAAPGSPLSRKSPACACVFGLSLCQPLTAGSVLFILMIMSSSICLHFSTFPFVKLTEQLNELKSFRKNTHPTIITVIKSGNYCLAPRERTSAPHGPESCNKDSGRSDRTFWSPFIHGHFMLRLLSWAEKSV